MNRSWNRLGHWADKRLPGLALFAFLLLMSQLEQARATDIELPAADDGNLSFVVLILVWLGLLLLGHDLRLVVCARARSVRRGDGRIDAFIDIALYAPAIELTLALATLLDRPPAPLALARWLPRRLQVTSPQAHEGVKRDRILGEGV